MANVTGLNVSPYLSSALSRIKANGQANAPKSPAQSTANNAGRAGCGETTNVLSDQTLGALVAMQADNS